MKRTSPKRTTGTHRAGAFGPFASPTFRAIWLASFASNLGSLAQLTATAWVMAGLTSSHQLVALVQAANTISMMLFGMVAGAIADNFDRRRVMLAAQGTMMALSIVLAFASAAELTSPFLLLAFTFLIATGAAFNAPAWQASVRMQVPPELIPQAISLNTVAFNLARSLGPALGGLILSLFGVTAVFVLNAVTYVAMIMVLVRWQPQSTAPVRKSIVASLAQGLAYCRASAPIRTVLMRGFAFGFGAAGYLALVPSIAHDLLGADEIDFGMLVGAFGMGSIIAAFLVSPFRRRHGSEAALTFAAVAVALGLVGLSLTASFPLALTAALVAGAGWVFAMTSLNLAMQLRSPENILGRCLSIYHSIAFAGVSLGSWVWGLVSDLTSLPLALRLAAGWLALVTILLRRFAPMPDRSQGVITPL